MSARPWDRGSADGLAFRRLRVAVSSFRPRAAARSGTSSRRYASVMQPARPLPSHVDVTGRRPVVRGTDIRVSQIASGYEHLSMTPDDIVDAHPHLRLADVHAALAYFYDHRGDIEREWAEEATLVPSAGRCRTAKGALCCPHGCHARVRVHRCGRAR